MKPLPFTDYRLPLRNGRMVELWIPREGLTVEDAERMIRFVETLVVDDSAGEETG